MSRRTACVAAMAVLSWAVPALAQGPAFDCAKADGTVEALICTDPALAALDRRMDEVFTAAVVKAQGSGLAALRAEQRGWIAGRNECWKTQGPDSASFLTESWRVTSMRECVEAQYRRRISELQAVWTLVTPRGPVSFACQGASTGEIAATFFDTDPATARLARGERTVTAYQVRAASGARYEGPDVMFWNKGQEASVSWPNAATGQSEALHCTVRP